jgi:hypothetical protein
VYRGEIRIIDSEYTICAVACQGFLPVGWRTQQTLRLLAGQTLEAPQAGRDGLPPVDSIDAPFPPGLEPDIAGQAAQVYAEPAASRGQLRDLSRDLEHVADLCPEPSPP